MAAYHVTVVFTVEDPTLEVRADAADAVASALRSAEIREFFALGRGYAITKVTEKTTP